MMPMFTLYPRLPIKYPLIVASPQVGWRTALKRAGPGHTPLSPQATPKATAPARNRQSISLTVAVGRRHFSVSVGLGLFLSFSVNCPGFIDKNVTRDGPIPKRMIKAKDGSKRDGSVGSAKNRKTLAESAIPEINRPSPNSSPAK